MIAFGEFLDDTTAIWSGGDAPRSDGAWWTTAAPPAAPVSGLGASTPADPLPGAPSALSAAVAAAAAADPDLGISVSTRTLVVVAALAAFAIWLMFKAARKW